MNCLTLRVDSLHAKGENPSMNRETDLRWFEKNRPKISIDHRGKWVVVCEGKVISSFRTEEEALVYSIQKHGIDVASVFLADTEDPVSFAG